MKNLATKYFEELHQTIKAIAVTDHQAKPVDFFEAIGYCAENILSVDNSGGKIMFIGNGANAGIASHIAADLSKNTNIPAMSFNDPVMLTASANDCGVENMFSVPIKVFAKSGDILIALSSSGNSPNIIKGIKTAREMGSKVITLTGFNSENPIRKMGYINFYSPSNSYALTEVTHHAVCHSLVNCIIEKRKEKTNV